MTISTLNATELLGTPRASSFAELVDSVVRRLGIRPNQLVSIKRRRELVAAVVLLLKDRTPVQYKLLFREAPVIPQTTVGNHAAWMAKLDDPKKVELAVAIVERLYKLHGPKFSVPAGELVFLGHCPAETVSPYFPGEFFEAPVVDVYGTGKRQTPDSPIVEGGAIFVRDAAPARPGDSPRILFGDDFTPDGQPVTKRPKGELYQLTIANARANGWLEPGLLQWWFNELARQGELVSLEQL